MQSDAGGETKKKKVVYGKKKSKPSPRGSVTEEAKPTAKPVKEVPVKTEKVVEAEDDVKDSWDATSEEEEKADSVKDDWEQSSEEETEVVEAKVEKVEVNDAVVKQDEEDESDEESSDEESDEEDSDEELTSTQKQAQKRKQEATERRLASFSSNIRPDTNKRLIQDQPRTSDHQSVVSWATWIRAKPSYLVRVFSCR